MGIVTGIIVFTVGLFCFWFGSDREKTDLEKEAGYYIEENHSERKSNE